MAELTQARLREIFNYDPSTGLLTWKYREPNTARERQWITSWNKRFFGKVAGSICATRGCIQVYVDGRNYLAHRLIWLMVYGKWPDGVIDHINGDPSDNRLDNIRDVTISENNKNLSTRPESASGHPGVTWYKAYEKWSANISVDGKLVFIGYFEDRDEAISARKQYERRYGFHPNHGRKRA